eukprot:TRINITY_DN967_c0_g1_i7.p1 TRINITY_DN967_c0_g1~~TRINITY_DN967_c0_g1_i7.p1  ORF type:complete len:173 (-),score=22.21 TRINITY_DN967_c0_g1_i7:114-581(-)
MPGPGHWLTPLRAEEALKAGTASQAAVQKHVSRLVDLAAKLDALQAELPPISRTADYIRSHRDLMFETATSSIVLLKNERDLVPICSEHFSARKRCVCPPLPAVPQSDNQESLLLGSRRSLCFRFVEEVEAEVCSLITSCHLSQQLRKGPKASQT